MKVMTVINPKAPPSQWDRLGDTALTQILVREIGERHGAKNNILITGHYPSAPLSEYISKYNPLQAIIAHDYEVWQDKNLSQKDYYRHIREKVREHKPDVIHIQQAQVAASSYISALATETQTPVIWTLHNPPEGRATFQYADSYREILSNPLCRIVCVSKSARDRLVRTLKLDHIPENLLVVYNGIVVPEYEESVEKVYDFIGVGRIDPPKNTEMMIDFMMSHPDKKCLFIGSTFSTYNTPGDYVDRCVSKLEKAENIEWIKSVPHEEVYGYMAKSRYYVNLSRVETFSLTSCEAMSVGTPVICFNEAGPGEIVPDYAGIKIKPVLRMRTSKYLESLSRALSQDYPHYDNLYNRKLISEYVRSNFSSESMYNGYYKLYKELVSHD